jgi:hypothetical protein
MDGAGVAVLMLLCKVRNHFTHDVKQIMLQKLKVKRIDIVRAFLYHNAAGGMMGRYAAGPVFYARSGNDIQHLFGDVVERGYPSLGLKFEFFLKNNKIHINSSHI